MRQVRDQIAEEAQPVDALLINLVYTDSACFSGAGSQSKTSGFSHKPFEIPEAASGSKKSGHIVVLKLHPAAITRAGKQVAAASPAESGATPSIHAFATCCIVSPLQTGTPTSSSSSKVVGVATVCACGKTESASMVVFFAALYGV